MAFSLRLLRGSLTLEDALDEDQDCLYSLSYWKKRLALWHVIAGSEWFHGSFNAIVTVDIATDKHPDLPSKLIFRIPLSYRVGEEHYPGNTEEKIRCEVATYLWLEQNAPEVPIPKLYGFGLPDGRACTPTKSFPLDFDQTHGLERLGYLLLEFVQEGDMLSETWQEHQTDARRTTNLYQGLARIMLACAKHPMPRIGSWTIDENGELALTNRPLTCRLQEQENLNIASDIPRDCTYSATECYYFDLIQSMENTLRFQPNAIHNEYDGRSQLAKLTAMRALLPKFADRELRNGPYVLKLTDLHRCNIFVDDDWNITKVIDLEWACVLPVEMLSTPEWISGVDLTDLPKESNVADFIVAQERFMEIFTEEEKSRYQSSEITDVMKASWNFGAFWYFKTLHNPTLLHNIFSRCIAPRFMEWTDTSKDKFTEVMSPFFATDTASFIAGKLKDQEQYEIDLSKLFEDGEIEKAKKDALRVAEEAVEKSTAGDEATGDNANGDKEAGDNAEERATKNHASKGTSAAAESDDDKITEGSERSDSNAHGVASTMPKFSNKDGAIEPQTPAGAAADE